MELRTRISKEENVSVYVWVRLQQSYMKVQINYVFLYRLLFLFVSIYLIVSHPQLASATLILCSFFSSYMRISATIAYLSNFFMLLTSSYFCSYAFNYRITPFSSNYPWSTIHLVASLSISYLFIYLFIYRFINLFIY